MIKVEEASIRSTIGAGEPTVLDSDRLKKHERFSGFGEPSDHDYMDDPVQVAMLRCMINEETDDVVDEARFLYDQ